MTCQEAQTDLSLYLYGELSSSQEALIEEHLEGCASCRAEMERERSLHRLMDSEPARPPVELLAACRRELAGRVAARARVPFWRKFLDILNQDVPLAVVWRIAGAAALVTIGYFGGRTLERPDPAADRTVTRVRSVAAERDGRVRLEVEEVRQKEISGRLEDDAIQQMLLAAAADPADPGLRAQTLEMLKRSIDSRQVRQTLLAALERDPNDGVRLKAIEGLRPFSRDPETQRALSNVLLRDVNPGIRTQAIDMLAEHMRVENVGALQELIMREDNPYIRQKTMKVLREMNASTETF